MGSYVVLPDDALEIRGLSVVLEAEQEPPYLELVVRCGGSTYGAAVLAAGKEWTLRMKDEDGKALPCPDEPFATQHAAVYAALLTVLDAALHPA